jgi:hypothetical protein
METTTATKFIARRISKGYNPAESASLLADLIARHAGENLIHALTFNEFATEAQARKIVR